MPYVAYHYTCIYDKNIMAETSMMFQDGGKKLDQRLYVIL